MANQILFTIKLDSHNESRFKPGKICSTLYSSIYAFLRYYEWSIRAYRKFLWKKSKENI